MNSNLSMLFYGHDLLLYLSNLCQIQRFSPMFFSWIFIVLEFIFVSLVHFHLIFVCGLRYGSKYTFCVWISSCSSTIFVKPIFLIELLLQLYHYFLFCSIFLFEFMPVPHLDSYSFKISYEKYLIKRTNHINLFFIEVVLDIIRFCIPI